MALSIEIGAGALAGRSLGTVSVDFIVPPVRGYACSPVLKIIVDFKGGRLDGSGVGDFAVLVEDCSKVDNA